MNHRKASRSTLDEQSIKTTKANQENQHNKPKTLLDHPSPIPVPTSASSLYFSRFQIKYIKSE
jgi:hypothetical protein